jgi:hypothetical protein
MGIMCRETKKEKTVPQFFTSSVGIVRERSREKQV